ncbi:uncharacterized protein [Trachinotus anak]|uniref:uncharacterized protein n=1 Tax=Trachinotus anak TaxID=443729 RepID=UPI0039F22D7B
MFRVSLIICVSLIFGITAKPYKPWNKFTDEAFQDTVMSIDDKGKMSWGMEVEPPEDMDETHYNIDPSMMIWKSMTGKELDKQPPKAEEDLDELHHPSMADLLKVQIQNLEVFSAADIQAKRAQEEPNMNQEPEEDRDDIDHPVFSKVAEEPEQDKDEYKDGAEVRVAHSEPEKDEDDIYHHDDQPSPVQTEWLRREARGESEVRVHLQPEEDMDDLYHRDLLLPIPHQADAAAAAPVELPSQRKHSEPEEDLDDLYHQ